MKKISVEFLITAFLFLAIWFGFSQVNWISLFDIESITSKTEEKLGDLTWEYLSDSEYEIENDSINQTIDSLVSHITNANNIDRDFIKVHIVQTDEINAFALPNGHLVINSELILDAKNQEELMGVIAHEIAHIDLNHVNEKLVKEIGLTVLISAATGGNNQIIGEIAKTLSSTAFDRQHEEEADLTAVMYLENADVNPLPFADFLYRLSDDSDSMSKYLTWISTHPDSKDRSKYVTKKIDKKKSNYIQVIDQKTWEHLKTNLQNIE